jgi:hypothetical protein
MVQILLSSCSVYAVQLSPSSHYVPTDLFSYFLILIVVFLLFIVTHRFTGLLEPAGECHCPADTTLWLRAYWGYWTFQVQVDSDAESDFADEVQRRYLHYSQTQFDLAIGMVHELRALASAASLAAGIYIWVQLAMRSIEKKTNIFIFVLFTSKICSSCLLLAFSSTIFISPFSQFPEQHLKFSSFSFFFFLNPFLFFFLSWCCTGRGSCNCATVLQFGYSSMHVRVGNQGAVAALFQLLGVCGLLGGHDAAALDDYADCQHAATGELVAVKTGCRYVHRNFHVLWWYT